MLTVKVMLDKERTICLIISKGRKSETTMAHKNKIQKYPVNTTSQNESCLLYWLKSLLEKEAISAGPK